MRKFLINVNGNSYEVEVEEIGGAVASAPVSAAPVAQAAPAPAAPKAAAPAGGTKVSAPMPGNILSVNVTVGQQVNEGDLLVMLEAMKMENEILAPCAGKVVAVSATKDAAVNTGDVLVVIG